MASPAPRGPGSPPEQQQQALPPAPPPAIRSRVSYMDQAEHHAAEAAGGGGGPEAPLPEHVVQAIADVHRPDTSEHPQRPSTRESRPTTRERHAGSSVGFSRESTLRRPGTHETDRSSAWERSHLGSRIKHRSLSHSKSRRARSYMTIESTDGTKVVIQVGWLAEWVTQLRQSTWASSKELKALLDQIDDAWAVPPALVHELLLNLPAREVLRFKKMAATTVNEGTTSETSLNHEYIDFAVAHTVERIQAQMEGRWVATPPSDHSGAAPARRREAAPNFDFLLGQFDRQVEAAKKIQRAFRAFKARCDKVGWPSGAPPAHLAQHSHEARARYLDVFKQPQHQQHLHHHAASGAHAGPSALQTPQASVMLPRASAAPPAAAAGEGGDGGAAPPQPDAALAQHASGEGPSSGGVLRPPTLGPAQVSLLQARSLSTGSGVLAGERTEEELRAVFTAKLLDRMKARAAAAAAAGAGDPLASMTEAQMLELVERQAAKLAHEAMRARRAAARLREKEARRRAKEHAREARREERREKKRRAYDLVLVGKLARAQLRRLDSLQEDLQDAMDASLRQMEVEAQALAPQKHAGASASSSPSPPSPGPVADGEQPPAQPQDESSDARPPSAPPEQAGSRPPTAPTAAAAEVPDAGAEGAEQGAPPSSEAASGEAGAAAAGKDQSEVPERTSHHLPPPLVVEVSLAPLEGDTSERAGAGDGEGDDEEDEDEARGALPERFTDSWSGLTIKKLLVRLVDELRGQSCRRAASFFLTHQRVHALDAAQDMGPIVSDTVLESLAEQAQRHLEALRASKSMGAARSGASSKRASPPRLGRSGNTSPAPVSRTSLPPALVAATSSRSGAASPVPAGAARTNTLRSSAPAFGRVSAATSAAGNAPGRSASAAGFSDAGAADALTQILPATLGASPEEVLSRRSTLRERAREFADYISSGSEDSNSTVTSSSDEDSSSESSESSETETESDESEEEPPPPAQAPASADAGGVPLTATRPSVALSEGAGGEGLPSALHTKSSGALGTVKSVRLAPPTEGPSKAGGPVAEEPIQKAIRAGQAMQDNSLFHNLQRSRGESAPGIAPILEGDEDEDGDEDDEAEEEESEEQRKKDEAEAAGSVALDAVNLLAGLDASRTAHGMNVGFRSGLNMLHHLMFRDGLELLGNVAAATDAEAMKALLHEQVERMVNSKMNQMRRELGLPEQDMDDKEDLSRPISARSSATTAASVSNSRPASRQTPPGAAATAVRRSRGPSAAVSTRTSHSSSAAPAGKRGPHAPRKPSTPPAGAATARSARGGASPDQDPTSAKEDGGDGAPDEQQQLGEDATGEAQQQQEEEDSEAATISKEAQEKMLKDMISMALAEELVMLGRASSQTGEGDEAAAGASGRSSLLGKRSSAFGELLGLGHKLSVQALQAQIEEAVQDDEATRAAQQALEQAREGRRRERERRRRQSRRQKHLAEVKAALAASGEGVAEAVAEAQARRNARRRTDKSTLKSAAVGPPSSSTLSPSASRGPPGLASGGSGSSATGPPDLTGGSFTSVSVGGGSFVAITVTATTTTEADPALAAPWSQQQRQQQAAREQLSQLQAQQMRLNGNSNRKAPLFGALAAASESAPGAFMITAAAEDFEGFDPLALDNRTSSPRAKGAGGATPQASPRRHVVAAATVPIVTPPPASQPPQQPPREDLPHLPPQLLTSAGSTAHSAASGSDRGRSPPRLKPLFATLGPSRLAGGGTAGGPLPPSPTRASASSALPRASPSPSPPRPELTPLARPPPGDPEAARLAFAARARQHYQAALVAQQQQQGGGARPGGRVPPVAGMEHAAQYLAAPEIWRAQVWGSAPNTRALAAPSPAPMQATQLPRAGPASAAAQQPTLALPPAAPAMAPESAPSAYTSDASAGASPRPASATRAQPSAPLPPGSAAPVAGQPQPHEQQHEGGAGEGAAPQERRRRHRRHHHGRQPAPNQQREQQQQSPDPTAPNNDAPAVQLPHIGRVLPHGARSRREPTEEEAASAALVEQWLATLAPAGGAGPLAPLRALGASRTPSPHMWSAPPAPATAAPGTAAAAAAAAAAAHEPSLSQLPVLRSADASRAAPAHAVAPQAAPQAAGGGVQQLPPELLDAYYAHVVKMLSAVPSGVQQAALGAGGVGAGGGKVPPSVQLQLVRTASRLGLAPGQELWMTHPQGGMVSVLAATSSRGMALAVGPGALGRGGGGRGGDGRRAAAGKASAAGLAKEGSVALAKEGAAEEAPQPLLTNTPAPSPMPPEAVAHAAVPQQQQQQQQSPTYSVRYNR